MNKFTTLEGKTNNNTVQFLILICISIVSIILSILFGAAVISKNEIIDFLLGKPVNDYVRSIIFLVRIPRTLGGFICGAALSMSGLLLQRTLNNSLASPSTIGVNSGAGLFVVLSSIFFPMNLFAKTIAAFLGAVIITLIVYCISVVTGRSRMTIILAGVAVTTLCNAIIDTIVIILPNSIFDKTTFYIGGLAGITYNQIVFSSIFIIIAIVIVMFINKQVDILILGDEVSLTLGVNVNLIRLLVILSASLMAGASVAISGLLGFVGLIIPHISSLMFENESKTLIPKTALLGGSFVVLADLIARLIFSPYEIPVGIILSLIGAPFFLYLLFGSKKKGRFV